MMIFRRKKTEPDDAEPLYYDADDDMEEAEAPAERFDSGAESIRERAQRLRRREMAEREESARRQREWRRASMRKRRAAFVESHRGLLIRAAAAVSVVLLLAGIVYYLAAAHRVTDVEVSGNTMRTDEEIADIVCAGPLGHNSLYLAFRYRERSVEDVPFVEKMTVEIVSPHRIRVTVYEKALAGYVSYLGSYMYFTRDGTVVESSSEEVEGIPEVTGLSFDHILLQEKLPVDDASVFDRILRITQLLNKYNLAVDRIYFDSLNSLTLFYGEVRVNMGQDSYMDEKISNLAQILPKLEGQSGTIDLTGFTPSNHAGISFMEKMN